MKAILASFHAEYCQLIASLKKSVELRKTKPKLDVPFKVYIYCTKGGVNLYKQLISGSVYTNPVEITNSYLTPINIKLNGKVIGEFVCDCIASYEAELWDDDTYERIQEFYEPDDFAEYGEYEYKTIATNEDDFWKENMLCEASCVTVEELRRYVGTGIATFYGWHISDLVIYDEPKELREFYTACKMDCEYCEMWDSVRVNADEFDMDCKSDWFMHKPIKRPPQSWCYVEELTL